MPRSRESPPPDSGDSEEDRPNETAKLTVTILEGRRLRNPRNANSPNEPFNPFIKVVLANESSQESKIKRTRTASATSNPRWHESVVFYLPPPEFDWKDVADAIVIEVSTMFSRSTKA